METFITFAKEKSSIMKSPINVFFMLEATEFIDSLPEKAKKKVVFNINRVRGGEMDPELFKKLGDTGIWEFRTLFNGTKYRLLSFWDKNTNSVVVATHGFIKKRQKTPKGEIDHAQALRIEYYKDKKEGI